MEAWREELYLSHHGIEGQKWGKRNGPPYPLDYGDHSAAEKKYLSKRNSNGQYDIGNVRSFQREIVNETSKIYKTNKRALKDDYRSEKISRKDYKKLRKEEKKKYKEQLMKDNTLSNKAIANLSYGSIAKEAVVAEGALFISKKLNQKILQSETIDSVLTGGMMGIAIGETVNVGMKYIYNKKYGKQIDVK